MFAFLVIVSMYLFGFEAACIPTAGAGVTAQPRGDDDDGDCRLCTSGYERCLFCCPFVAAVCALSIRPRKVASCHLDWDRLPGYSHLLCSTSSRGLRGASGFSHRVADY